MDQTGRGEKPFEDVQHCYARTGSRAWCRRRAVCLEFAGALKRRVEDVNIRIRRRRRSGRTCPPVGGRQGLPGAPRRVATEDNDGDADRFWAAGLACAAVETEAAVYALHRIDNHADLRDGRTSGGHGRCGGGGWAGSCSLGGAARRVRRSDHQAACAGFRRGGATKSSAAKPAEAKGRLGDRNGSRKRTKAGAYRRSARRLLPAKSGRPTERSLPTKTVVYHSNFLRFRFLLPTFGPGF